MSVLGHLLELVQYRELILNLIIRELKARYKSSALGFLWSLLNPLGMMLVFTFVFTVMWPNFSFFAGSYRGTSSAVAS
jgi:lipopolysaccharide transport system permease protein